MALPVFAAELPLAQAIAIVPIQTVQVVTTTTTITGDPMTARECLPSSSLCFIFPSLQVRSR